MSEHLHQFPQQPVPPSAIDSKTTINHQQKKTLSIILGLLFLLPALGVVIFTHIMPIIRTFILSLQDARLFDDPEFIGFENYQELFEVPFLGQVVIFTLLLILTRVVLVLIPPLFLALGASSLKPGFRKIIRIISTIPWVLYSPLALGISWLLLMNPMFGFANQQFNLANPDMARGIILLMDGLSFFGLACGLGLTVYLSALKGESERGKKSNLIGTMLILAAVLVISTIVVTLQSGSTIRFITNGGPQFLTMTFNSMILNYAFAYMRLGMAAAIASPVLLITIIFGIGITLLMIMTNFQIFSISPNTDLAKMPQWLKIISIILMIFVLIGVIISMLPYILKFIPIMNTTGDPIFDRIGRLLDNLTLGKVLFNTWLAPLLIVFLVQFPVTFLAALGIGALRPFGKASEWLLLLFAPWLLVTPVLLIPGMSQTIFDLKLVDRYIGLALPYLINLPMLFILTFFFRGQAQKYAKADHQPGFFKHFIVPALPLTMICLVFGITVIQQELVWSMAVLSNPERIILPGLIMRLRGMAVGDFGTLGVLLSLIRIPAVIFGLIFLGGYQVLVFPRLGIRSGKEKK